MNNEEKFMPTLPNLSDCETIEEYEASLHRRRDHYMALADACIRINVMVNRKHNLDFAIEDVARDDEMKTDLKLPLHTFKDPITVAGYFINMAKIADELRDAVMRKEDHDVNRQGRISAS